MTSAPPFLSLGDARFVSLTTFKRSGEAVSTTVWVARDGDALLVTTPDGTGKVKRIRNSGRVELRQSSRMGKVDESVDPVHASAVIVDEPGTEAELERIFSAKYRTEYRIFLFIERRFAKGENKKRVMIRMTAA